MKTAVSSGDAFHFVDHVLAFDDLAKHRVTPALCCWCSVIQKVVVGDVDKELCSRGVWIARARHGECVLVVFQAIVGFVFNGSLSRLLLQTWLETSTLNHETVDHAVENRTVKKTVFDVCEKIRNSLRCFFSIQRNDEVALVGGQFDAW